MRPFTFRQRQVFGPLVLLWALITLLCALAGPFGTHEAMLLPGRLGYWGVVVGVSLAGSVIVSKIPQRGTIGSVVAWAGFVLVLALCVSLLNTVLFPIEWGWANFLQLLMNIGVSVVVINGLAALVRRLQGPPEVSVAADPAERFLRRLPIAVRAPLVRIEAQDHYLMVVTEAGSATILMRLGDAVEELEGLEGIQPHRSHWVALKGVVARHRAGNRDVLEMSDGAEVPLARNRRAAAKEAGLV